MKQELRDVVLVAYGRAPIAKAKKGSFADIHPATYGAETLKGVLARVPSLNPLKIDDVIVGCAMTQGVQSGNFAKTIVLRAGLPDSVPAMTINRYCSSGLQVIALAANGIATGQHDVVVAGGVESMSRVSMLEQPEDRDTELEAARPGAYFNMGITAENVAEKYNISRLEMEQMAVESHAKADAAQKAGVFKREIIPVTVKAPGGTRRTVAADEGIRAGTNLAALAELKPAFREDGRVTAATSSQMSDGAAFVVLMSAEKAADLKLKPLARLAGFAVTGVACEIMGIGPIAAVPKVLALTGMKLDDIDVIELNEAFAAQAIPCIRELGLDPKKVNPRGGALALGHPLGATGTILTCKALSYLEDTGGKYALVTMCIGGGMGAAGIIEKL
ncbi:MAG: thiolase family protein [Spirochaetaceae bacterium]|jgi:acetyl-CoA acyltransferase|nr:thiolase family protein [Spirochaetaceae bacterium]